MRFIIVAILSCSAFISGCTIHERVVIPTLNVAYFKTSEPDNYSDKIVLNEEISSSLKQFTSEKINSKLIFDGETILTKKKPHLYWMDDGNIILYLYENGTFLISPESHEQRALDGGIKDLVDNKFLSHTELSRHNTFAGSLASNIVGSILSFGKSGYKEYYDYYGKINDDNGIIVAHFNYEFEYGKDPYNKYSTQEVCQRTDGTLILNKILSIKNSMPCSAEGILPVISADILNDIHISPGNTSIIYNNNIYLFDRSKPKRLTSGLNYYDYSINKKWNKIAYLNANEIIFYDFQETPSTNEKFIDKTTTVVREGNAIESVDFALKSLGDAIFAPLDALFAPTDDSE